MHKVCVVIPVYKTKESLLRNCISSVMMQTLKDIEIIIVDDGSPDNCGKICDEYAAKDSRIQVIHKKNEGVSVARNMGIEKADSKYVSFVDSDDWIDLNTLEIAYNEAEHDNVDILQWTYVWHLNERQVSDNHVFMNSGVLDKIQHEEMILKSIVDFYPTFSCNQGFAAGAPWAKLYKRELLIKKNLRFVPGLARSQDRIFNLYAYEAAEKIKYIDKPMSHYVANDTSAVVSYRPNVEDVYKIYLKKIREFIANKKTDSKLFYDAYTICVCYVIQQILTQFLFHRKNPSSFFERYREVKRIARDSVYSQGICNCESIKGSITHKQLLVYRALKAKLYMFATIAMYIKASVV